MSNDAACSVSLSEEAVPEVVLRNKCFVVSIIVEVAVSVSSRPSELTIHSVLIHEGKNNKNSRWEQFYLVC